MQQRCIQGSQNLRPFACLAWLQDVVGRHILKVEPLNAILDPQYFVRAVHGCVLAVLRARSEQSEQRAADNAGFRCNIQA